MCPVDPARVLLLPDTMSLEAAARVVLNYLTGHFAGALTGEGGDGETVR